MKKMESMITLRLPKALLEEIDKLAKKRSLRELGNPCSRADVIRTALLREVKHHA